MACTTHAFTRPYIFGLACIRLAVYSLPRIECIISDHKHHLLIFIFVYKNSLGMVIVI